MNKFIVGLVKIARFLVRPFFPVKVYGERNIPNKKSLIVCNHVSGWDPVIFTMWMKNIIPFVYKAEFRKSKFLKWVFDGMDCIPVRRGEVDMTATKSILKLLKNDNAVCLYPEGTRNPNVDCLQEFHTGAALFALKTKSSIRPMYIWDKTKFACKNYIIVGDELSLEEYYDQPINRKTLEEVTEIIKNKVDELRIQLNKMLDARGVKRRRRTKKELAKIQAYNEKKLAEQQSSSSAENASHDDNSAGGEE